MISYERMREKRSSGGSRDCKCDRRYTLQCWNQTGPLKESRRSCRPAHGQLTKHRLGSSHAVSLNHREKPLSLTYKNILFLSSSFSSALSYAQICRSVFDFSSHASLWNLLFGGITNGGKLWNTPHLRQWQNYCVSPPGCHNPSQSIRSASQLPIQSKAFSGKKTALHGRRER